MQGIFLAPRQHTCIAYKQECRLKNKRKNNKRKKQNVFLFAPPTRRHTRSLPLSHTLKCNHLFVVLPLVFLYTIRLTILYAYKRAIKDKIGETYVKALLLNLLKL